MKILLVSDNHGNLTTIKKILQENKHDIAIHLGDGEIPVDFLKNNFDYYICGNHENWTPLEKSFVIQNLNFFYLSWSHKDDGIVIRKIYVEILSKKQNRLFSAWTYTCFLKIKK